MDSEVIDDLGDLIESIVDAVFRGNDDHLKRHCFCAICNKTLGVKRGYVKAKAICGYKKEGHYVSHWYNKWPFYLFRRDMCKRCKELALTHARCHANNSI